MASFRISIATTTARNIRVPTVLLLETFRLASKTVNSEVIEVEITFSGVI